MSSNLRLFHHQQTTFRASHHFFGDYNTSGREHYKERRNVMQNTVKQDPGRVRQNSQETVGTIITKPPTNIQWEYINFPYISILKPCKFMMCPIQQTAAHRATICLMRVNQDLWRDCWQKRPSFFCGECGIPAPLRLLTTLRVQP